MHFVPLLGYNLMYFKLNILLKKKLPSHFLFIPNFHSSFFLYISLLLAVLLSLFLLLSVLLSLSLLLHLSPFFRLHLLTLKTNLPPSFCSIFSLSLSSPSWPFRRPCKYWWNWLGCPVNTTKSFSERK